MVDEMGGRTCYALYQPELLPRRWGRLDLNQRPRSPLEKTHPSRIDQRKIGEVVASGFFDLITERNRTDQLFAGVPAKVCREGGEEYGSGENRTHGPSRDAGFQDQCLRPLGHASKMGSGWEFNRTDPRAQGAFSQSSRRWRPDQNRKQS